MWAITALLVVVAWTGAGFVAVRLFFRLGFGFEARRDVAEHPPRARELDLHRRRSADPSRALAPVDPRWTGRRRGERREARAPS